MPLKQGKETGKSGRYAEVGAINLYRMVRRGLFENGY